MIRFGDAARPDSLKEQRMSALSQKRTFAVQKKACPLYPRKETLQSIYSDSRHSSHRKMCFAVRVSVADHEGAQLYC